MFLSLLTRYDSTQRKMSITEHRLKGLVYTQGGKGVVLLFEDSFPLKLLKMTSVWCQKMNHPRWLPPPKKTSRKRCWKAWRVNWKLMNVVWIYLTEDFLTNISWHSSTINKPTITWHENLLYFAVPPQVTASVCIFKHEEHITGNRKGVHFAAY